METLKSIDPSKPCECGRKIKIGTHDLASSEINDACFAMLDEFTRLEVKINGHTFNNLKPAFYAGYLKLKELENQ